MIRIYYTLIIQSNNCGFANSDKIKKYDLESNDTISDIDTGISVFVDYVTAVVRQGSYILNYLCLN